MILVGSGWWCRIVVLVVIVKVAVAFSRWFAHFNINELCAVGIAATANIITMRK